MTGVTHTLCSISQGGLGRMLGLEGLVRHLGGGPVRVPRRDWTRHLGVAACFESKRKGGQFVNLNQLQTAISGKIEGCYRCASRSFTTAE